MSVYRPKNSTFYHFDFQRGRRRFHGSTGETERRKAEALEAVEIKKAESVAKATRKAKGGPMTMNVAAGRYWTERGQHTATAAETFRNIERLVAWIGKDTAIADISDDMLRSSSLAAAARPSATWPAIPLRAPSAGPP